MPLFHAQATLLQTEESSAEDQTGTTYVLLPDGGDSVPDHSQEYRVWFLITQIGGASSPTTDCILETSPDGDTWVTVASATQLTADGSIGEWKEIAALGSQIRVRTVLGGGTPPEHTATVILASTGGMRLLTA